MTLDEPGGKKYEQKLLAALNHVIPERRIMAAQILGNLGSQAALGAFLEILNSGETNYYILRAILIASAKINHPERITILETAARSDLTMVARLAQDLLAAVRENRPIAEWDRSPC